MQEIWARQLISRYTTWNEIRKEMAILFYLDGHGCKDDEITEIESKRSEKESQLVLLGSC